MRGKPFQFEMPVLALAGAPFLSFSCTATSPFLMSELDADLYGGKYVVTLVYYLCNFFSPSLQIFMARRT